MGSISDGLRAYWASAQAAGRRAKDEKDRIAAKPGQAITAAKSRVSDTAAKALGAVQRSRISVSKAIEDKKSDFEQAKRDVGAKVRRATDEAKDVRSVIKHEIMGKPDTKDASREQTRNISMSDQSLRRRTAEGRAQTEAQNENQRLASKASSARNTKTELSKGQRESINENRRLSSRAVNAEEDRAKGDNFQSRQAPESLKDFAKRYKDSVELSPFKTGRKLHETDPDNIANSLSRSSDARMAGLSKKWRTENMDSRDHRINKERIQANSKNTEKVSKTGASIRARK